MTALELHRQNPSLELAPILRVVKYMGLDSSGLSEDQVALILRLYPDFESDPELVVGCEAVARLAGLEPERLTEVLGAHRHEIPYLGTTAHPIVPTVAIDMIRAIVDGEDPLASANERLYTLTDMAERTGISLASLSKYVKEHADRIPSRRVGKMRKFPVEAAPVFREIKQENLGRRGNGRDRLERHKAAVSRRYATKFAELEEQLDTALAVSKDLTRTLKRLNRQVRRARSAAEAATRTSPAGSPNRARRSGGHRPHTIVAACKKVLAGADEPMRVADITERVIAMGTPIKAKNPNVTISSILSSYEDFGRVRRGYYELLHVERAADPIGDQGAGDESPRPASTPAEPQLATSPERDPDDVLADLRAAADADDAARPDDDELPAVGLEPFGATG